MKVRNALLSAALALLCLGAAAQEATIRKNLAAHVPQLQTIDEVNKTPLPGLYEVRVNGNEIFYTDAEGNFIVQGQIFDLRKQRNITAERLDKLNAIDFSALPLKDAFVMVRGNGKRKLAVFEDPNCGYCKRFERDLESINDVTVYIFLFPILGADSTEKAKNIWCAKDKLKTWQAWMQHNQVPAAANCDTSALSRNLALGRKHKITGTPTLVFSNGSRIPGAVNAKELEKLLAESN